MIEYEVSTPVPFVVGIKRMQAIHAQSGIVAFSTGDAHLCAKHGANNSALLYRVLGGLEEVVGGSGRCIWVPIGDTYDSDRVVSSHLI
jgi:hypothetical protein